ncbi:septal ring lytic transglycosylase RlpA family protein [Pseudanabaena sp. PCC 6802]|uniref:septal ring lytic transglycosylase RlpA family protein n=1 Tax=Pseudanabaena sp. PCC 6802 TaxID=118173 RepID=UPI00034CAC18|nr:septal ring lytic transglycosylase RlpA family protein [Pseudanabaena sp. PCC 6802]
MVKKNWGWAISALISALTIGFGYSHAPVQAESESTAQPEAVSPSTSVLKVGETRSQSMVRSQGVLTRIHPHPKNGYNAATVYVRNIPVFTFLGQDKISDSAKSKSSSAVKLPSSSDEVDSTKSLESNNPVERATAVAALIDRFNRDGLDAKEIVPAFESGKYVIKLGKQSKIEFDRGIVFSETIKNQEIDVLQAANLLRRLVGNAAPVSAVANTPVRSRVAAISSPDARITSVASGFASWYGPGFHGAMSASGEIFNANAMTAAHRTLPFGTQVRVTNMDNGQSVVVRINDRGPYAHGRVIDISEGAARAIGLVYSGVAPVRMEVLGR